MKRALLIGIIGLLLLPGCSWLQHKEPEKSAEQLVNEGMEKFNKGNFTEAIDAFQKLKDWYPFSKYAIVAELKLADAYYERKNYDDAVTAYEHFESLHPRNEAVPYVVFQMGMCYFHQLHTPDRDQTSSQKALEMFQRVMRQYPDSSYGPQAMDRAWQCMKNLAEHELYVGKFYYKMEKYEAALSRLEDLLQDYPDVGVHSEALDYIARCKIGLSQQEKEEKQKAEKEAAKKEKAEKKKAEKEKDQKFN